MLKREAGSLADDATRGIELSVDRYPVDERNGGCCLNHRLTKSAQSGLAVDISAPIVV
jgi:hypothetical protein